eukprot:709966-Prorocentrum_minimum.AAC.1
MAERCRIHHAPASISTSCCAEAYSSGRALPGRPPSAPLRSAPLEALINCPALMLPMLALTDVLTMLDVRAVRGA